MADDFADDIAVVKACWKSAHAVEDWPGTVILDRFLDRRDKYVYLQHYGRLAKREIRSMSDAKSGTR